MSRLLNWIFPSFGGNTNDNEDYGSDNNRPAEDYEPSPKRVKRTLQFDDVADDEEEEANPDGGEEREEPQDEKLEATNSLQGASSVDSDILSSDQEDDNGSIDPRMFFGEAPTPILQPLPFPSLRDTIIKRVPSEDDSDNPDPIIVTNRYSICKNGPIELTREAIYGKWLVLVDREMVNGVWQTVWPQVVAGRLGASAASVSTKLCSHGGPYSICVYVAKPQRDNVAIRLSKLVRRDMKFVRQSKKHPSDALWDTRAVTKMCFWNRGSPSFKKLVPLAASESLRLAVAAAKETPELDTSVELILTVKGIKFHNTRDQQSELQMGKARVQLVREPRHPYDRNAIAVRLTASDTKPSRRIGYLSREDTAILAPWMDRKLITFYSATLAYQRSETAIELVVRGKTCAAAKPVTNVQRWGPEYY